jgi:endoglucanase Acf2
MHLTRLLPSLGAALLLCGSSSDAQITACGAGSYSTRRPDSCKALPETIYRTSGLKGAVPTNQWWSSLVWKPLSENLFPHPLGMVCTPDGLAVAYPGGSVTGRGGHIMSGGIGKGDLVIGHSAVSAFTRADCDGASDWFIDVLFAQDDKQLRLSFGHGSPFVFARHTGGDPVVRFPQAPRIWSGSEGDAVLGVTAGGHPYALFGPTGCHWTGTTGGTFTLSGGKGYFSIALLPDDTKETLGRFAKYAHLHVTGTRLVPSIGAGRVTNEYRFETRAMEGTGSGTLFALYPHQWNYMKEKLSNLSYGSVRGEMKVGEGSSFRTSVPIQGVLPHFPAEGIAEREAMLALLKQDADKAPAEFADTYWEGKHLGKLATLAGVAEAAGDNGLRTAFLTEIKRRLENWFTASPGEDAPLFYYDANWGTLVGSKPSYGSDMPLNDHHFHYGYFIRAAAEVARHDPSWAKEWGPMVELVIRDIASPNPADPMFPNIRCFDKYAGHSWASGNADFADGNNQESSSESMNAWYGIMLWGAATGNDVLRDLGVFLFNTERTAIEEYWFDVSGTNYPADFPHVALGMIWGGKGAFGTWFSGDIDCIHGINWLPFTPSSIYMGRFPAYVKTNHDRIVSQRKGGADYNNGWGDLVVMFRALAEPREAAAWFDAHPDCKLEGGNTRPFMSHWLHTLDRLGVNDPAVVADTPFFNVFVRNGRRTHAVFNYGSAASTVRFSDGTTITAKPSSLTTVPASP